MNYFVPIYAERGLDFKVVYLPGAHTFRQGLLPSIGLADGFMTVDGVESPHLFTFCTRAGHETCKQDVRPHTN